LARRILLLWLLTGLLALATLAAVAFGLRFLLTPGVLLPAEEPAMPVREEIGATRGSPSPTARPIPGDRPAPPEMAALPPDPTEEPLQAEAAAAERAPVQALKGDLAIPRLGLHQAVMPIPVQDGQWDISNMVMEVGWLETTGTGPGDDLAMVLIGHVTLPGSGDPGPFYELPYLREGAEIHYREGDRLYIYRVEGKRHVDPENVAELYVPDGRKLLLVTCTNWNPIRRAYSERAVVEARLVRVEKLTEFID